MLSCKGFIYGAFLGSQTIGYYIYQLVSVLSIVVFFQQG